MSALNKIFNPGKMTIGLEFPLDNDWSLEGERKRKEEGRPFGIPDTSQHERLIKQADKLDFSALWIREVPVYDPSFGDGAQLMDTLSYLGYISGITEKITIGTAAIVLPLHNPLQLAKAVATIDNLSGNRYLFGVGLGDRPIEFPLFGFDFESRAERFVLNHEIIKEAWKADSKLSRFYEELSDQIQIYPKPKQDIPWVLAGRARQSMEWIVTNMQAWFNYPRIIDEAKEMTAFWRDALKTYSQPEKPYISALHLNLAKDPDKLFSPHRFGGSVGINRLSEFLKHYERAGVNHMALHLRKSDTPIDEALDLIAEFVLPEFPQA